VTSTANGPVVVTGAAGALGRAVLAEFRRSLLWCCQEAAPRMTAAGGASVTVIASSPARMPRRSAARGCRSTATPERLFRN
jgi:uncharacterized protein YbjT (DUF2867 family)